MYKIIKRELFFTIKLLNIYILTPLIFFSLLGCLPSEEAIVDKPPTEETFGQFTGLDSVETIASSKVKLSWTKSKDNRVVAYNVYDVTLSAVPKLLKSVDATRSEATLAGLSEGFYYSFRVRAVDKEGNEDVNTKDIVGIPYGGILGVLVLSSSSAEINFSGVSVGEALEIIISCKTSDAAEYVQVASIRNMQATKQLLNDLTPNLTYTCKANILVEGYTDNNSETISFQSLGKASQIVFDTQPGNGAAGDPLSQQPIIKLLDENGNLVTGGPDSTALVTLELSVNTPTVGSLRGTISVNAVGGVVTFTDVYLQESGAKIINAIKEDTSAQFFGTTSLSVESTQFNISPGNVDATQSLIAIDPSVPPSSALVANGTDTYTVTITLNDSFGNPISGIKPKFVSNIVGDFIIQPFLNTDAFGQATGSLSTTVADNVPPARILSVSSPAGLSDVQSLAPFVAGQATKLAFSVQPANSPAGNLGLNDVKVSIQDQQGNRVVSGASSSLAISMSIASNTNGAVLSGVSTVSAVNGLASFLDLGIDLTKTGYNLVASSGSLTPAYSNSFNITAGVPQAVSLVGPTNVLSGSCSTVITVQLQDLGANPAKAIQNTTILLSGMGNAVLYSSNSCGGSPLGSSVTFTPGTDTRTVYLKSNKVEALNISATDTSSVLSPGVLNIKVNPNKMNMLAEAFGGGTLIVPSGQCSTAITITPLAEDGSLGEVYSATNIMMNGIVGSQAKIYSDSSCTIQLNSNSFPLTISPRPSSATVVYLKDPKGEILNLNVSDPGAIIQTTSVPQEVRVTASKIDFVGPATVVAGACSSAFTVTLKDTLNNNVPTIGNLSLNINGIDGFSTTGKLYTSPTCGSSGSATSLTIPDGNASVTLYYKGIASEILNIYISDPAGILTVSQTVQLTVTPSAFEIVGPGGSSSLTSGCVGPFAVNTLDGLGDPANAVNPITATLSGEGIAGTFYSDSQCTSAITQLNFGVGQGTKLFYFVGQYPASLTLVVSDLAAILTQGTISWTVNGDWGWFGSAVKTGGVNEMLPFRTGIKPIAARYDGMSSAYDIEFSPDYKYLYVADYYNHKVIKFDYENNQYIGWMGRVRHENGVGSTGSNLANPSTALCVNTTSYNELPGWCTGGVSIAGYENEVPEGSSRYPRDIAADNNYIYVAQYDMHSISRYEAQTGAFAGWIGLVYDVPPAGPAVGGPAGCSIAANDSVTPGWCLDGKIRRESDNGGHWRGDGRTYYTYSVVVDDTYLYVGTQGAVHRFNKITGTHAGWIGMVYATPTSGAPGCTAAAADTLTPGWCFGGEYKRVNPYNHLGLEGGIYVPDRMYILSGELYVVNSAYGSHINKYNISTGAFVNGLVNMNHNWKGAFGITHDGNKFYIADSERILRIDSTGLIESWMGKVANNAGMSGNAGCSTLNSNDNTPGWCIGGTGKGGLDSDSFIRTRAIAYDGNGSLLVSGERFPGIKKFNSTTGIYEGVLALESNSPSNWTSDRITAAEEHGLDDKSMYSPRGVLAYGDYVYIAEYNGSRIKKVNKYTGELIGWIGGMTSKPTGGSSPLCLLTSGMGPSPSWCKNASYYPTWLWYDSGMIDYDVNGIMNAPYGLTTDGTWLYVTDRGLHRVQRFKLSDGSYGGWIGRVNTTSPTGGDPGCAGAPLDSFTPGWCTGGYSKSGNGFGYMSTPSGISYMGGSLYVINVGVHNISKYNAITGAFEGWIGRVDVVPTSGCTPASNGSYTVSNSGWCLDGTSQSGHYQQSRGGDFNFDDTYTADITNDGVNLFVTNGQNRRIEKFSPSGQWQEAVYADGDNYTKTWSSDRNTVQNWGAWCSRPQSIWMDGNDIYVLNRYACARSGSNYPTHVVKINKTTGTVVGWKGGIDPDFPTSGGDPGCSGAVNYTPGWCQGGRVGVGSKLGNFMDTTPGGLSGDNYFLYITDYYANRVVRVPR